jgi:hypothetical protein
LIEVLLEDLVRYAALSHITSVQFVVRKSMRTKS